MNAIDPAFMPQQEPRELPYNEEAEQALLGALLLNNEVMGKVEGLKGEHFRIEVHGRIFDAITAIIERGQVANPVTLKTFFEADASLAGVGGAAYLTSLATMAATIINAGQYAAEIRSLWERRQVILIAEDAIDDAYSADIDVTSAMVIEKAEQALYGLAEEGRGLNSGPRTLGAVTLDALAMAEAAYKRPGGVVGISTGLRDLDNMLGGFQDSDLIIVGARPSMGKSGLGVNFAYTAASHADNIDGGAAGFWSLEMASEQISQRLLGELSGIPSNEIRTGKINGGDFDRIVRASQAMTKARLYIDDTPALAVAQLRARARRLKRQHDIKLVVVDYLQLLRASFKSTADSRVAEVSEISGALKALAKELHIPVVALCQLSRAVEQRADKRPMLSDLRESGTIEQDADVVIFIYRDEYYAEREEPDPSDGQKYTEWRERMARARGKAELIVAKHRHGPVGTVHVRFDAPTTKFSDQEA